MEALFQQVIQRVRELYDSPPGSPSQREADKWLTGLVDLEEAWGVLLHVVGNAAAANAAASANAEQHQMDVRLIFISTKMLQLKIQRHWKVCPPQMQQVIQQALVTHLQQQALGNAAPDAPIVHNQMVLAFVHMLLHMLADKAEGSTTSFVAELCQTFGITGTPDFATQLKPLLLVLEILKGMPEEHNRRDPGASNRNKYVKLPIKLLPVDSQTTVNLIRLVLDRCDETNGNNNNNNIYKDADMLRKIKLAALQCLHSWVNYTVESKAWISLVEMMVGGLLVSLERQASLVSGAHALPAEMYALLLQIITDGLHTYATESGQAEQEGDGNAQAQAASQHRQVFHSIARVVLAIGRYVMQPGNNYADAEEVAESACLALMALVDRHLATMFLAYQKTRGTPEGEADLLLFREVLLLLVQFTGHADISGVAEPPLELWYYLPETLDVYNSDTPEARALLAEVEPPLVETIHRQCIGSASWGEKEWSRALLNRRSRRGGESEVEDESDWEEFSGLMSFRSEANDTIEAMAVNWPEKHRVGEILYSIMTRSNDNPLAVEAVLLCLTGVARGLQSESIYLGSDDDDEEGGGEGGGDEDYDDEAYLSEQAREQHRQETARRTQADLWLAVLQAITSLQDPATCFYLWHTACLLIRELAGLFLMEAAAPTMVQHVFAFLVRGLSHHLTCSVAATSLRHVVSACCSKRGNLAAGKEEMTKQEMINLLTAALTVAHGAPQQSVLMQKAQAYAKVIETLVMLMVAVAGPAAGADANTLALLVDQLGAITTSALSPSTSHNRTQHAMTLGGILAGGRKGQGPVLMDSLLQRTWPIVEQAVFGPLGGQEDPTAAVKAVCDVLMAILHGVVDKQLFLPLLLAKVMPLIEFNDQVLHQHAGAVLAAQQQQQQQQQQQRGAAGEEIPCVPLWPAPIVFLRRVVEIGGETDLEGWWPAFQQVVDSVCRLSLHGLELRIGDDDEAGNPERRRLLVDFYEQSFMFVKELAVLATEGAPPVSAVAEDAYCIRRSLQFAILALELPLENSGSLKQVLGYLDAVLRLPEELVLPALQDELPPRLVLALLKVLVITINMPSNIQRLVADVLHLALFGPPGEAGGERRGVVVGQRFQQALSLLVASEGEQQMVTIFAHDLQIVPWVRQSFLAILQTAPPKEKCREFIKYFAGLGRKELSLAEVLESVEMNRSSTSIFPDL